MLHKKLKLTLSHSQMHDQTHTTVSVLTPIIHKVYLFHPNMETHLQLDPKRIPLVTSINESFENNICYPYNHHNLKCFWLQRGFVSNEDLDIILGEFQRLNDLNSDSSNCGEDIPLDSIDVFWRKLDISDTTPVVNDNILCDDIVEKIKESFKKQSKAGKQAYMRKLQEIYDPNTRKRKSVLQIKLLVDTTSQLHHSLLEPDLNDEPPSHDPFQLRSIPDIFHDYIDDIHDVKGDGYCGFQAVTVCLGYNEDHWLYIRKQLLEELESHYYAYHRVLIDRFNEVYNSLRWFEIPAPFRYWLHMPLTGYLISNKFGVIPQTIYDMLPSLERSRTVSAPRAITLAFVNGNHYVSVFLKKNYTMPPTIMYWNAHRSPSASTWEIMYWSRFELYNQLYNQLRPRSSVAPWIHID
uniref:OTU domain-containing protein n=1 Tax=Lactuca sativa TaxID=4236 RepID=A0A9R1XBQ1_LACSA|nr:hypothetical protein LSAT_V11C500243660 [Lactuca sativa]